MIVTLLIFTLTTLASCTANGYFDVVAERGVDFSFTCPFKVEDTDILTITRINVTHYGTTGSTYTETPKTVFNTSTGGLTVGLESTERYNAFKDEQNYYAIYISKAQPEDSGTWKCTVKKPNGDILSGSYERLIVLGADVNLAFQRRLSRSRIDVYADELEIDLTEPQLKTVAFVVNVSGLMAVRPNASITSCYEDGSSYNITSRLFHATEFNYAILSDGLTGGETYERFGGRSLAFVGNVYKTRGKVTLEGIYQYADRIFTRSITVKLLAPPIINPEKNEVVYEVVDDTVIVSTYVVAHPRISAISIRLQNQVTVNFTDLYNNNVSHKDNITLSIFKVEGKFYNWYNLTVRYKTDLIPGYYGGNSLTVSNSQGSNSYYFYLNQVSSGSSRTICSAVVLSFMVLFTLRWF